MCLYYVNILKDILILYVGNRQQDQSCSEMGNNILKSEIVVMGAMSLFGH